ncbi:DUF3427 domain-containing protein [Bacillus paranthracis]|uniref:DUF3427 domain-containing protein n=1 Tax=Bacillus paranthracis TaxID=2026186 RepID=UPI0022E334F4|nr:DUF3427 domain-containing protein [Bacillus paranthracis]MED0975526.1 DUF3427 domain-containing protein [Bacillus paranthracis]MED1138669.1 DUF3427 domain-containing protein [Bacillus paranthracis]
MKKLELLNQYTREDIYNIFDGVTPFTPGAGTWGIHGIVKIPDRPREYVFFVTFGQDKLGQEFKESITEKGVLTWQSQKKQGLKHPQILDFISHDHQRHNIYLFLRTRKINPKTNKTEPFTYMGRLAYLAHDLEKEHPVLFKWQLLDFELSTNEDCTALDLTLVKELSTSYDVKENSLLETSEPEKRGRQERENNFSAKKNDFEVSNKKNKKIGFLGELLVFDYIHTQFINAGRHDLAEKIMHTSVVEGDGAGYDIRSFKEDGSPLYLEVKTTKGGINSDFFISPNELAFSEEHSNSYQLIRVYEYNSVTNSGKFYKIEGNLNKKLNLRPVQYSARF